MFRYIPLVIKNSWRNRRRTTLTVLSIGASLSLLGVLMAVYHAFYLSETPPDQALRLAVRHRVSLVFSMPESYGEKIRRIPGVREVMTQQWFGGVYKDRRDPANMFARFAIEPDKLFTIRGEITMPEDEKVFFQRERASCIIGRPLAERLGLKAGDRITIQGDIFPLDLEFVIAGLFDAPENNEVLYFHRKYLDEGLGSMLKGTAGLFAVLADSAGAVPRIAHDIDETFRNSPVQTKTEPERAFQLGFINSLGNVKAFLLSICAAVAFTVLLVSANTVAMSVRERVREIGILKTLGFSRDAILGMVLGEALMVSLGGGLLGLLIASGLCAGVRRAPAFIGQLKTLSIEPPVAFVCLGAAALVGLVSALVPAWGAANTSIVDALKTTD